MKKLVPPGDGKLEDMVGVGSSIWSGLCQFAEYPNRKLPDFHILTLPHEEVHLCSRRPTYHPDFRQ